MTQHKRTYRLRPQLVLQDRISLVILLLWLSLTVLLVAYDLDMLSVRAYIPGKWYVYPLFLISGILAILVFRSRALDLLERQKQTNQLLHIKQKELSKLNILL